MQTIRIVAIAALFAMAIGFIGCNTAGKSSSDETISLCGKCGQIKGTEVCCIADTPKCDKCGLAKGSPGCCKLPEAGKDAALCGHCGQIKGSDVCCKADAPKCDKCGMAKGSPGCCILPKKV